MTRKFKLNNQSTRSCIIIIYIVYELVSDHSTDGDIVYVVLDVSQIAILTQI